MSTLIRYRDEIEMVMSAATSTQVQSTVDQLVDQQEWELLGILLLTGLETAARRMIALLIEREIYEPLAWGACLRRQLRPPIISAAGGGLGRRVFRDIDAEEDTAGVPEHILADATEMAAAADQQREAAQQREAQMDRDPIRSYIVDQLSRHLNKPEAREVVVTIAQASAWEETRREAALKLANHKPSVQALLAEGRTADLIAISNATGLEVVTGKTAQGLGDKLSELQQAGDMEALRFVAENHPDASIRAAAQQALS